MVDRAPLDISILTSCTGKKRVSPLDPLTTADFEHLHETEVFHTLEARLAAHRLTARELYTGEQHLRLIEGIEHYEEHVGADNLALKVLSAGYGVIDQNTQIVPYECTFQTMKVHQILEWSNHLGIPQAVRLYFRQSVDLCIVVLGESYLRALQLDDTVEFRSPTLIFTGMSSAKYVRGNGPKRIITLTNDDARRFRCGLVGLKGELAKRVLHGLVAHGATFMEMLFDEGVDTLAELERAVPQLSAKPVISLPDSWREKSHRERLRFFIPDWDDMVDPDYDFEHDLTSRPVTNWSTQVYAHELYSTLNSDGILVSRAVTEKPRSKADGLGQLGVHAYLRVPSDVPILGDCGAFSYLLQDEPPYSTDDVLDYYTNLGFDLGVSVDHLIFGAKDEQGRLARYQLTIDRAEQFIVEHRKRHLQWTPIGAVQGWNAESYAAAAEKLVAMGYTYIGLGGLVRSRTAEILEIASAVHQRIGDRAEMHLFGVARPHGLRFFSELGIRSVDTASYLRSAWTRADYNYLMPHGAYKAIRIPEAGRIIKKAQKASTLSVDPETLFDLELRALRAMRAYEANAVGLQECLETVLEYDQHIGLNREAITDAYERTLADRPWEQCACELCRKDGIQIAIFRGNNRNRRRGFHNSYVYYQVFESVLAGAMPPPWPAEHLSSYQLPLPLSASASIKSDVL